MRMLTNIIVDTGKTKIRHILCHTYTENVNGLTTILENVIIRPPFIHNLKHPKFL